MKLEGKAARRLSTGAAVLFSVALLAPAARADDAGKVSGKITFEGTPPAPTKIKMDADPVCAQRNPNGESEEVVVTGGGLANVFVRVTEGLPAGKTYTAPTEAVTIDQNGCHYIPHVVGAMVGQPVQFLNNDGTLHNVHGMPKKNDQFNFAMPKFVKKKETSLKAPEVMIAVKCDVHPWMNGFIGVVENPYFAVSAKDGTYTISGLPAGEYTIEAWHEKLGTKTAKVKVEGTGTGTANFQFKAS